MIKKTYNLLNQTILGPKWLLNHRMKSFFHIISNDINNKGFSILDIGCNDGWYWDKYFKNENITGLDISPPLKSKKSIIKGDAQKLPFKDKTFDVIFLFFMLDDILHPLKALDEVKRVLKPAGKIYLF